MIPLMRPQIPHPREWKDDYLDSTKNGVYTNFGKMFDELHDLLNSATGRHCLPVTNGTVAIEVAALTTFSTGTRIAVPDFTCVATLQAINKAGMVPVIFPTNRITWTIDVKALLKHHEQYDHMCVVSPFGYPVNVSAYEKISEKMGKGILYDFAGAWGMFPETRWPVTYSFHATKNFGIGEGGCVMFRSENQYENARRLTVFDYDTQRSSQSPRGFNGKMDELRCTIARAHLLSHNRIEDRIRKKRVLHGYYMAKLGSLVQSPDVESGCPSLLVFKVRDAEKLETIGNKEGIEFKRYYYPVMTRMRGLWNVDRVADADPYFDNCIAFPSDATVEEADKVCQVVKDLMSI